MKNLKKKTDKTQVMKFQLFIFSKPACLQKLFHGASIMGYSVSPQIKTIVSRDQFKPLRIGENLVVNFAKL